MLVSLYIENYALIRNMEIRFFNGLTVITGETGAGKSIILGALGLILGQRADSTVLQDSGAKCIVEAGFNLERYKLDQFFMDHDLDSEEITLLRREINPQGKSRAFINDTPVNLAVLKELGDKLVDIHSQHETLYLRDPFFQLEVLDQYAGNNSMLDIYSQHFHSWKTCKEQLAFLKEKEKQTKLDHDFNQFLFQELDAAALSDAEQESLEEESGLLSHAGEIKSGILSIIDALDQSDQALLGKLSEIQHRFSEMANYHPLLKEMNDRIAAVNIEVKDLSRELVHFSEHVQVDPVRQEWVQSRLDTIYTLQKKHGVTSIAELNRIKNDLDDRLADAVSLEDEILTLTKREAEELLKTRSLGEQLTESRKSVVPGVRKEILGILAELGMPNASIEIIIRQQEAPGLLGFDQVTFLFSANKGSVPGEINKIASGGELSRLMLAVKSMISRQKLLPTLIFDEIDMGISGETASRVGHILQKLSEEKQLIVITHLPQIAGKGNYHYYIYKIDNQTVTTTHLKILNEIERVEEIARMISGDSFSGNTLETARELLENNNQN
ncbi:MAG: DNA repair protein RecN [Bacteroidales bacterium]